MLLSVFAAVLQSVLKRSYNRMLNHCGISHYVAEWRTVERSEQFTDILSNSQETFAEWQQVCFYGL